MRARVFGVCLVIAAVAGVNGQQPASQGPKPKTQDPQVTQPVFRAGIELVTVDVTALDNNTGRQVTDLTAKDFEVEIDGDRRQVTSAEYVRSVDPMRVIGAPHKVVVADETFASSNAKGAPSGRLIMILVDQGNIRTGSARSVMNSAKRFVDTLTPEDRVAVVAIPGPGELVDFTTNHDRVRESLLRIVGQAGAIRTRFNLSITESMAIYMRSDAQLALEVILRECGGVAAAVEAERCEREVEQDAAEVVSEVRQRTADSVHGMRSVFQSLAALEGPKSVILLSEGLIFEGLGGETDDIASLAADARATLDVLLLDVPMFDVAQSQRPTTPREDRNLQVSGLEQLAGASRGNLHRINTSAEYAFDRISRSLDGYYLLGVESRAGDRDGRQHRLAVKSLRRGVTIRSRRTFLTTLSGKATTAEEAVSKAIRSPLPINDLPLRLSTWTYKEPGTSKVRVLIAAEAERLAGQSLEYTTGMAMVNKQGRGVAPPTKKTTLTEKSGDPGTAVYSGMIAIDPGEYRLIVSMADSEGRVGSVSRAVTAWAMDSTAVTLGDLLLGSVSDSGQPALEPAIEPTIVRGQMAALMEAYGPPSLLKSAGEPGTFTVDGTLEILKDENSPPLATMPLRIGSGPSPEIATASAHFNTTALPPGRYLARGVIRQGGKPQGHLLRPFRIGSDTAKSTTPAAGGALPAEMVTVLLGGLPAFDRKELLTPAMLTAMYTTAESRASGSTGAIKEARGGDLGGAAMTALGEGDQVLAMFLKGLELYQQAQLDRAAMQFQNSMQLAPQFAPSRLYLGATLAEANRHREAAGLLQAAASAPPNPAMARLAGEEWIKAGQPALAIAPLELAVKQPAPEPRAIKLLGIAYVLGGRPADAVATLTPYLETNPKDTAALIAAIFGTYIRHLNAPQPETLPADRANIAKWSKAYAAAKAPMQPLVTAWVAHVQGQK
jgi:VWFA-related protein